MSRPNFVSPTMNKVLKTALKKAKLHDGRSKVWCGAFTPAEIIELIKDGHKSSSPSAWQLDYIKQKYKKGEGGTHWFYFHPTGTHKPYDYAPKTK